MRLSANDYVKAGRICAIVSFITGTILLGLYALFMDNGTIGFGLMFISGALIINAIVLLAILIKAFTDKQNRVRLLLTSSLMLLNIPVIILYIFIAGHFANTVRLHLNNSTKSIITDIHITGCQDKRIDKLLPGEKQTIVIDIPGDCTIDINYLQGINRKNGVIASYVTNDGGQNITYNIGGHNDGF